MTTDPKREALAAEVKRLVSEYAEAWLARGEGAKVDTATPLVSLNAAIDALSQPPEGKGRADDEWGDPSLVRAAPVHQSAARDREADRTRLPDLEFNQWLDEPITENGEFSVWHQITNIDDAHTGWTCRASYERSRVECEVLTDDRLRECAARAGLSQLTDIEVMRTFAALTAPSAGHGEGWVSVPKVPTEAMHQAAVRTIIRCTGNDDFPPRVWAAMLAASPTPKDNRHE